jgi:hypothetical protein
MRVGSQRGERPTSFPRPGFRVGIRIQCRDTNDGVRGCASEKTRISKYSFSNFERECSAQKLNSMDIPSAKDPPLAGVARSYRSQERAPLHRAAVFSKLNPWEFSERSGPLFKLFGRAVRLKGMTAHVEMVVAKANPSGTGRLVALPEPVGCARAYGWSSGSETVAGPSASMGSSGAWDSS